MVEMYPSPSRPARRIAAGARPPIQSGGPPGRAGPGASVTGPKRKCFPSWATRSSVQKRRSNGIASSMREPRSSTRTPTASNSGGNSPPTPIPNTSRPFDKRSRAAADLATCVG